MNSGQLWTNPTVSKCRIVGDKVISDFPTTALPDAIALWENGVATLTGKFTIQFHHNSPGSIAGQFVTRAADTANLIVLLISPDGFAQIWEQTSSFWGLRAISGIAISLNTDQEFEFEVTETFVRIESTTWFSTSKNTNTLQGLRINNRNAVFPHDDEVQIGSLCVD